MVRSLGCILTILHGRGRPRPEDGDTAHPLPLPPYSSAKLFSDAERASEDDGRTDGRSSFMHSD